MGVPVVKRLICGSPMSCGRRPPTAKEDTPDEIQQQYSDNLKWIEAAEDNNLVVGSCARILYADDEGRRAIANALTKPFAMVAYKVYYSGARPRRIRYRQPLSRDG